jgi:hypothetical protein
MKQFIKQETISLLKEYSDFTFPELINELQKKGINVSGNRCVMLSEKYFLWYDVSLEFVEAIIELQEENELLLKPSSILVYSINSNKLPPTHITVDKKELKWKQSIISKQSI